MFKSNFSDSRTNRTSKLLAKVKSIFSGLLSKRSDDSYSCLNEEEKRIVKDFMKLRAATVGQFALATDRYDPSVKDQLDKLVEKKFLERYGKDRGLDHTVYTPSSKAYFLVR